MITNVNKWWHCFIEWKDTDEEWKVSVISWCDLINCILNRIIENDKLEWTWIPPWKIKVAKN